MILLLGGFLGSGRSMLARNVARRLNFHYYNIDQKKLHMLKFNARGEVGRRTVQPSTDAERQRVYARVIEELPLLTKMHPNIIVDDSFHRAAPREFFFSNVKTRFKDMLFVWIDSDDQWVEERFASMLEQKMIQSIEGAQRRRARAQKRFQQFEHQPLTFFCGSIVDLERDTDDLARLIREKSAVGPDRT